MLPLARPFLLLQLGRDVALGVGQRLAALVVRGRLAVVQAGDLAQAREMHARITPTAEVFYAEPWVDMHNRMKEALVLLGKLPRAVVRPPLAKLGDAEIERIRQALLDSGLLRREPGRDAA